MGYGTGTFDFLKRLGDKGLVRAGDRILELGAQEINNEVSPGTVLGFIERFNPSFDSPATIVAQLPGGFVGPIFEAAGFEYTSIDLYDAYRSIILDLNTSDLPSELNGRFDLVSNFGTTEHVCNQLQAFKVVHDAMRPGGSAVHQVPFTGMLNHGLIKYEPKFFVALARENAYRIVEWGLSPPHGVERLPDLAGIPGSAHYDRFEIPAGLISFVIQKVEDRPFAAPSDVDLRHIERDFPPELQDAVRPLPLHPLVAGAPSDAQAAAGEVAGSDSLLGRLESFCRRRGLGPEPYVLAITLFGPEFAERVDAIDFDEPGAADTLDQCVRDAFQQKKSGAEESVEIDFGKAFLGTGWGLADSDGAGLNRSWRWIGSSGAASLFVHLIPSAEREMRTLIHDARPGPAVYTLKAAVNDCVLADQRVVEKVGGDWWHVTLLPENLVKACDGRLEVVYSCGDQRTGGGRPELSLRKVWIGVRPGPV